MINSRTKVGAASVADHYDELDPIYRALWGEHVHHGLWSNALEGPEQAVEALSDYVVDLLDPAPGSQLVDIGCGYGAAARRIARQRLVEVTGLTLSAAQATHSPPQPGVRLTVGDWLDNGLADQAFDAAYAIESSEHMADKPRFFSEAARVLKPGGRLVVCAWLAETNASPWKVRHLLEPICREGRLPSMGTREDYAGWADEAGLHLLDYKDLSRQVARTWTICLGRLVRALVTDGDIRTRVLSARNRVFAFSLPRLILAYRCGAIRYGVFAWQKA
ncbi:class I SAM-dependent methyltransferase [Sphingomonas aerophila]|uniref:Tocopherol O-methyltransferase n=1 Tax=Sphingomonas aerophila TaxID=1344948 RepID=A0A7W9BGX8_9SPHN|nr:class I SAM-dependent methyltransferase [Sphingomonas aerophila]MBB5716942.1 tocopherol O-methyltransferase [Sphingomonas aerophila]